MNDELINSAHSYTEGSEVSNPDERPLAVEGSQVGGIVKEPRWSLTRFEGKDCVLMDRGVISAITWEEIRDALNSREPVVSQDQEEQDRKGWILSRERMPDFDGEYLIYGFMHEECGNVHPFQKVVTCRFNQWVKSDVGEQMTYWRPLLPAPIIKSIEDHP